MLQHGRWNVHWHIFDRTQSSNILLIYCCRTNTHLIIRSFFCVKKASWYLLFRWTLHSPDVYFPPCANAMLSHPLTPIVVKAIVLLRTIQIAFFESPLTCITHLYSSIVNHLWLKLHFPGILQRNQNQRNVSTP